jgi:glyoxylase-like metal-dependent hydrolase (beta-lactamase superfamily II)
MSLTSRREFLARSGSCVAHLALAAAVAPDLLRAQWARTPLGPIVATEPFGSLEKVADGIWALVSTPLGGDRTTLSNGGLIAGRSGVIAIEGFNQPNGAAWLGTKAHELTGRWPTHVVVTHYHGDHANGVAGYVMLVDNGAGKTVIRATERTRDLVLEKNQPADPARSATMQQVVVLPSSESSTIDLGDRRVRIVPRSGHTDSDVSVEIEDPSVVFCGDLVWNAMFPNYVDAVPSKLAASVKALRRDRRTIYVPGHGPLARETEFDRYASMLAEVEQAARRAKQEGRTPVEAGAAYALPASLGEWTLFNKVFFERAFAAWYRELGA